MPDDELAYPDWQRAYRDAVLELDTSRLAECIAAAELSISQRLQVLASGSDHHEERQAIFDAMATLRWLKLHNLRK